VDTVPAEPLAGRQDGVHGWQGIERMTGKRMQHILIASLSYDAQRGGGGVRLMYDLAHGFARQGYRVTVVCEDLHGRGVEREVDEGVTVLRYRLPAARGLPLRRDREHIAAVSELLHRHLESPPDVIHGHSLFQYVAALRMFGSQARCCYTIHSPFADELPITWRAQGAVGCLKTLLGLPVIVRLERECLQRSHQLTAESEYTRTRIRALYGDAVADRIVTVPGWVDLERFRPLPRAEVLQLRKRLNWRSDVPVFFVLRRLEARMGLDNLLRALVQVRASGHRFHTYIGGEGSQRTYLEALRERLGLTEEVTFMGFVSGEQLPLAYAACDASVVPTAQLECFGIIALEAISSGRPALVTPVGALPEVVSSFEPGWVGAGGSPEAIAKLLGSYLDGDLPWHSPDALRDTLRDHYSFAAAMARYHDILLPHVERGTLAGVQE
jgi:glycosyltransferase involved in cell wall biosynthesis